MKKLYIITSSTDQELILKTLFKSGSDKVCLIVPKQKKDARKESDKVVREISETLIKKISEFTEVEALEMEFRNYDVMMDKLVKFIKKHGDYEITVNISVGYHFLTSILLNIASIFHLKVQYTHMTELNPELLTGKDWHSGFKEVVDIPTIPTNISLTKKELDFFKLLNLRKSLIVQDYIGMFKKSEENKRRAEFNYHVEKFQKLGLIEVKKVSVRNVIMLTPTGRLVLKIQE